METYSEEYRHKCEVEFVASHDGLWIKEYLAGVELKRGTDAYEKLRKDVLKVWRK